MKKNILIIYIDEIQFHEYKFYGYYLLKGVLNNFKNTIHSDFTWVTELCYEESLQSFDLNKYDFIAIRDNRIVYKDIHSLQIIEFLRTRSKAKIIYSSNYFSYSAYSKFSYEFINKKFDFDYVIFGEAEVLLPSVILGSYGEYLDNVYVRGLPYDKYSFYYTPSLDIYEPDYDALQRDNNYLLEFSRGCNFSCSYCDQSKMLHNFRNRSTESILKSYNELKKNKQNNLGFIVISCNMFSSLEMYKVADIIAEKDILWGFADYRVWTKIKKQYEFKNAKNLYLYVGVESIGEEVCSDFKRPFYEQDFNEFLEYFISRGAHISNNFIVGGYCESIENMKNTRKLCEKLIDKYGNHIFFNFNLMEYRYPSEYHDKYEEILNEFGYKNDGTFAIRRPFKYFKSASEYDLLYRELLEFSQNHREKALNSLNSDVLHTVKYLM